MQCRPGSDGCFTSVSDLQLTFTEKMNHSLSKTIARNYQGTLTRRLWRIPYGVLRTLSLIELAIHQIGSLEEKLRVRFRSSGAYNTFCIIPVGKWDDILASRTHCPFAGDPYILVSFGVPCYREVSSSTAYSFHPNVSCML